MKNLILSLIVLCGLAFEAESQTVWPYGRAETQSGTITGTTPVSARVWNNYTIINSTCTGTVTNSSITDVSDLRVGAILVWSIRMSGGGFGVAVNSGGGFNGPQNISSGAGNDDGDLYRSTWIWNGSAFDILYGWFEVEDGGGS